jgi:uncharacterized protein
MKIARFVSMLCFLATAAGSALAADVPADKRAEIERLLETTGALAMGQQVANFFIAHFAQTIRQHNPNVPQRVIDALPEEVNAAIKEGLPDFKELIIPVYDKYFTLDELRGLNAFYATPVGRKTVSVMPTLLGDSMKLGAQWGQAMEPRINERIRARFKKDNIKM